jgi:hypothetical protein
MRKTLSKPLKVSTGWKGNVFYPDGEKRPGYGLVVLETGDVVFPVVPQMPQEPVQVGSQLVITPKQVVPVVPPKKQTRCHTSLKKTHGKRPKIRKKCIVCGKNKCDIDKDTCSASCRQRACRGKQLVMAGIKC